MCLWASVSFNPKLLKPQKYTNGVWMNVWVNVSILLLKRSSPYSSCYLCVNGRMVKSSIFHLPFTSYLFQTVNLLKCLQECDSSLLKASTNSLKFDFWMHKDTSVMVCAGQTILQTCKKKKKTTCEMQLANMSLFKTAYFIISCFTLKCVGGKDFNIWNSSAENHCNHTLHN